MLCPAAARAADPLPALGAERSVTVSGLSSGGYMAMQMHVAHSSLVKGAGVIAGGPYYCAQGSLAIAYYNCMKPAGWAPLPPTSLLRTEAARQAEAGRIDSPAHLAAGRAWLFSGTKDTTVRHEVVDAALAFYRDSKTTAVLVNNRPAGHAMVTEDAGNKQCGATQSPYINDCDYDAAGQLLAYLLGAVPPAAPDGRLLRFAQDEFAGGDAFAIGLAREGFAYVPKACEGGGCRIHVAFHGCRQNAGSVGERFAREAGYNRWAAAHRLVVLYPQTADRYGLGFGSWTYIWNPNGCWDWWGYTGALYHTREGAQIRAVAAMIERLSAPR